MPDRAVRARAPWGSRRQCERAFIILQSSPALIRRAARICALSCVVWARHIVWVRWTRKVRLGYAHLLATAIGCSFSQALCPVCACACLCVCSASLSSSLDVAHGGLLLIHNPAGRDIQSRARPAASGLPVCPSSDFRDRSWMLPSPPAPAPSPLPRRRRSLTACGCRVRRG